MLDCKRCDYNWKQKGKNKPKICPRCKSKLWDEKKVRSWEKTATSINMSKKLFCSFCGKSQDEVQFLVAGKKAFICEECIEASRDIICGERIRISQKPKTIKE